MLKKLLTLGVCAMLAATGALYSAPAQAQSNDWFFVNTCGIPDPHECPFGYDPWLFGPFSTFEQCDAALAIWSQGPLATYPRSFSDCFQY